MNNKVLIGIIVAIVAVGAAGAFALSASQNDDHMMNNDMNTTTKMNDSSKTNETVETNMITYKGFDVVQPKIKVKKGTTVTWTNQDSAQHDVTPDMETDEFKASKLFGKGETYSVTFNTVGTFSYYCSPHPYMKGIVEVTE